MTDYPFPPHLADLDLRFDGPVPEHLREAERAFTRECEEHAKRDPEGYWLRCWQHKVNEARRGLDHYRARLVEIRTGRIGGGPALNRKRRRSALNEILACRQKLRALGVEWIEHRRARLASLPIAWQSPLDNIYCCAEADFLKDGGTETEFASAVSEWRRAA